MPLLAVDWFPYKAICVSLEKRAEKKYVKIEYVSMKHNPWLLVTLPLIICMIFTNKYVPYPTHNTEKSPES